MCVLDVTEIIIIIMIIKRESAIFFYYVYVYIKEIMFKIKF